VWLDRNIQIIRRNLLNPSPGQLDSPETLVPIHKTTHHILEDRNINLRPRQSPKYVMVTHFIFCSWRAELLPYGSTLKMEQQSVCAVIRHKVTTQRTKIWIKFRILGQLSWKTQAIQLVKFPASWRTKVSSVCSKEPVVGRNSHFNVVFNVHINVLPSVYRSLCSSLQVVTIKALAGHSSGRTDVKQRQTSDTGGLTIKQTALLFFLRAAMQA
jgi:hypothetical protein